MVAVQAVRDEVMAGKMRYRALKRLNLGMGYREPGELVPEAEDWTEMTRLASIQMRELEAVYTADEPGELHPWADPNRWYDEETIRAERAEKAARFKGKKKEEVDGGAEGGDDTAGK